MTTTGVDGPVAYNPYAYEMHEDPYPTYARLRAEAPVYRNDEFDFWALSRHEDVLGRLPQRRRLLQRLRASRSTRAPSAPTPTAPCRSSPSTRPGTPGCGRWWARASRPSKVNAMEERIREITLEHLEPALERGIVRLHRRLRRQGADGRDLRAGRACRRPTGPSSAGWPTWCSTARTASSTCPPEGMEAALTLVGYYQAMVDERRGSRTRRPHLGPARRRDRRRQAHRRGDRRLPLPHGGGRQRDDHQAARQRLVLGMAATPTSGPSRSPTPRRVADLDRGDPPLRHLEPDAAAGHPPAHRAPRHDDRRGRAGCCCWSGSANRDERGLPRRRPLRPRPGHQAGWSASAAGATSAWAHRWPASRPASRLAELVEPGGQLRRRPRTASSGSTPSTSGAWPPCRPR